MFEMIFARHFLENTNITRHHEACKRFRLLCTGNVGEKQTPRQHTGNYCTQSPSYII